MVLVWQMEFPSCWHCMGSSSP